MSRTEQNPTFGYARLTHQTVVQIYATQLVPAAQIAFCLGKLLPMGVDLWIGTDVPAEIPADWIKLEVVSDPSLEGQQFDRTTMQGVANRTRGWFRACRDVVVAYIRMYRPNEDVVQVIENVPEETPQTQEEQIRATQTPEYRQ